MVGYDELASGRYEDWLGQLGIGVLAGGAGGSLSRAARLRRIVGSPKLVQLGRNAPRWGEPFAGRRLDFSKAELNARPGHPNQITVPDDWEQLAAAYPRGVRYTRAGHPIFTPYAIKRVVVKDLDGNMGHDVPLANRAAKIPGRETPDGYTWHHLEDGKTMELVPDRLHEVVAHTGGRPAIVNHRAGLAPGLGAVTPGADFTWKERTLGGVGAAAGATAGGPAGGAR